MNDKLLKKYANLLVERGVNVQKDQVVIINAPIENYKFGEMLVEEAYKKGAKKVFVNWNSTAITKANFEYQTIETLTEIPEYAVSKAKYQYENKACRISITSPDPDGLKGLDFGKMKALRNASEVLNKYTRDPYMASQLQWTVAAIPNQKWAQKVFPNSTAEESMEKLWDAILTAVHIDEDNDPVKLWEEHDKNLMERSKKLNDYNFDKLKFTSSNGTNFEVGLVKNHIWAGGCDGGTDETPLFDPNMPTEEIFTMPHKDRANGKVVSTKPLDYQGTLIENFYVVFKDGVVVESGAEKGEEALNALLNTDEGSRRLGEVALVPYNSPISNMNILFYNTLFDENASCHLAFGNAYVTNIKDGTKLSPEVLKEEGYNVSMNHVDFMIGTADMKIIGVTQDGKEVEVFVDGNFVI